MENEKVENDKSEENAGVAEGANEDKGESTSAEKHAGKIIGEGEGTVKWFNSQKGFGFIAREEGEKDLFVHLSSILNEDGEAGGENAFLNEGDKVKFAIAEGRKGLEAREVLVTERAPPKPRREPRRDYSFSRGGSYGGNFGHNQGGRSKGHQRRRGKKRRGRPNL